MVLKMELVEAEHHNLCSSVFLFPIKKSAKTRLIRFIRVPPFPA